MHAFNSVASIDSVNLQENCQKIVNSLTEFWFCKKKKRKKYFNFFNFVW